MTCVCVCVCDGVGRAWCAMGVDARADDGRAGERVPGLEGGKRAPLREAARREG